MKGVRGRRDNQRIAGHPLNHVRGDRDAATRGNGTRIYARLCELLMPARGCPRRDDHTSRVDQPIGGPFEDTDDRGNAVTDAGYRGGWMLVFFGCRDYAAEIDCSSGSAHLCGLRKHWTHRAQLDLNRRRSRFLPVRHAEGVVYTDVVPFGRASSRISPVTA
jgi:hypothetical protein